MALYKYAHNLRPLSHPAFDAVCEPLSPARWSGIYRCDECGREIVAIAGTPLPPDDHHQHRPHYRPVRWRLLVAQEGHAGKL